MKGFRFSFLSLEVIFDLLNFKASPQSVEII